MDQLSAPPLAGATSENVPALSDAPLAIFLDVDGTLLDLAERPDDVVTPRDLIATLAMAERKLAGALALISGRAIEDLDRLFEPLRLRASGIHSHVAPKRCRFAPWTLSQISARSVPGCRRRASFQKSGE